MVPRTGKGLGRAAGTALLALAGCAGAVHAAVPVAEAGPQRIVAVRARSPVAVDGRLDEAAWREARIVELPWEVEPGENVPAPVATRCRVVYDDSALYVGCEAGDPDPTAIRARYTDRDAAFDDDFVGVILDTFHDRRRAYEFFVNPLGVQMDLLRTAVGGRGDREDPSWDAIWSSAGRLGPDGYTVEMAIPFRVLRFAGEDGRSWGISFVRVYPREHRYILVSEPVDRGNDCDLCQISELVGLEGVRPGRSLELDPTLTAARTQEREELPAGPLTGGGVETDLGLTARWGVSPGIELAAALNPDFSQVEADVAQLDVNRTFTLFYPEKRPFFQEGADLLATPLNVVYTRAISDPRWGVKAAGKEGRHALGLVLAEDEATTVVLPGSEGSSVAEVPGSSRAAILRYRFDVGSASTLGVVGTARDGRDGYRNAVWGVDGLLRLGEADTLTFQALTSAARYPRALVEDEGLVDAEPEGTATWIAYDHASRDWRWYGRWEDLDGGFRADLGFVPRVGTRKLVAGGSRNWWGDSGDLVVHASCGGDWDRTVDDTGAELEEEWEARCFVEGPRETAAWVNLTVREVAYSGRRFDQTRLHFSLRSRPSAHLFVRVFGAVGDEVDYENVRPGAVLRLSPRAELTVGRRLRLDLSHTYERLDVDGGRLYTANLSEMRGVYQFGLRTFVRAILQYRDLERAPELYTDTVEARSRSLFAQLLFSYKLNPQTVLFLGYSDGREAGPGYPLTLTGRTVFLKLGYALLL